MVQDGPPASNQPGNAATNGSSAPIDDLEELATTSANQHGAGLSLGRRFSLQGYLKDHGTVLLESHGRFASDPQLSVSSAGEWFLDNFHVIQEALRQVEEDLPPHFYLELPTVEIASGERSPQIRAVAREIISWSNDYLVFDQVRRYVRVYQGITSLTMGELWALPSMLRLGILEDLTQAAAEVTGLDHAVAMGFGQDSPRSRRELPEDRIIANCILSLRGLAAHDWNDFFESVSQVDQALRGDPQGVYARMDFETRDRYRKVVEELAKAKGQDEKSVAEAAVQLAKKEAGDGQPDSHVGYYLVDEGRADLETCLGYRPGLRERLKRSVVRHPTEAYLGGIALLTALLLVILLGYAWSAGGTSLRLLSVVLVALLPATAAAVHVVNWLVTHALTPSRLPAMDCEYGIPAEGRAIVLLPTMLTDEDEVRALLRQLERHYLGNPDPSLSFALLTDFADAPQKHMPGDDQLIEQAVQGIRELNGKYGGSSGTKFYLFHRERQWNGSEGYWMGWERKRGKLGDFNRLLLGEREEIHFAVQEGDLDDLHGIEYAITLDRDTIMPRDSARQLIATIAHPLNRARFDPHSGEVVGGYTVLQPRLEVWPPSTNESLFAQIYAGDTVVDLYTRAVSNVYQDFFGEGIYAGKGIYDVAAFERSLAGRVPQNALLSHDLFEGLQGRAGLCTTVTFYEDFPAHYLAYAFRQHRWIRGDWQLLPWLFPRVPIAGGRRMSNGLSLIDRWKVLDNLRRSLVCPSLLALLLAGWLWLPGSALAWTGIALLMSAAPFLSQIVADLIAGGSKLFRRAMIYSLWTRAVRWLLGLVFLTYETLIIIDAIGSTLVRLFITHRHLLQWTTAAHTIRLFRKERRLALAWVRMVSSAVLAVGFALLLAWLRPEVLAIAAPFILSWLVSPQIAHWISRPVVKEVVQLSLRQRQQLRSLARRTWLYFEHFVGPEDHWLPPDHYQEEPRGQHARRTSPTNIGMQLLSTLAAFDLGYVGAADLAYRLRFTFDNLAQMERHRGHFLNWYDTRDLHPLLPRYVSTVDSGNLAGCLLALKRGCRDAVDRSILSRQSLHGWTDQLNLLSESLKSSHSPQTEVEYGSLEQLLEQMRARVLGAQENPAEWRSLLVELTRSDWPEFEQRLRELLKGEAEALDVETVRDLRTWSESSRRHLQNMLHEIDSLLPWLEPMVYRPKLFTQADLTTPIGTACKGLMSAGTKMASLAEVPQICQEMRQCLNELQALLSGQTDGLETKEALAWCCDLTEKLDSAEKRAGDIAHTLDVLAAESEEYFQAMDFQFLFDQRREVFHIGYNISAAQMDKNYYDLLASEARLASLVAIAKGDVPKSHWLHLSRAFTLIDGTRTLLSWSGTMFEYLMPQLLMRSYSDTLLHQAKTVAVERQIAYARQRGVPWGISESGYYLFDAAGNYQYKAFGVPGLGLKRGLSEELVVAPYASLLALSMRPMATLDNLSALIERGMLGRYGLYEAVDYTTSRVPPGQQSAIVRSYMAHHQGMILLSIVNYLCDDVMVGRFHADPRIQATGLILHEQIPSQAPAEYPHPQETRAARPARPLPSDSPYHTSMRKPVPETCLLSNGRYSVLITSAGGGYSEWNGVALTRWRADTTLDNWGTWIYVQDRSRNKLWSVGYQPTAAAPGWEEVLVYAHKVEFRRKDHDISLRAEVTVSPDDDVEIRRVTLTNDSNLRRDLWLSSYAEVVLGSRDADARHQAFGKLFVESEYVPELNTLLFRRRPRSDEEEPIYLAHLLVTKGRRKTTGAYETDRVRFLDRGQTPREPAALTRGRSGLSGTTGATLDPIMCIGQRLRLLPHTGAEVACVTLAATSREEALTAARRYQSWLMVRRAFGRARDIHRQELREMDISTPELERMQKLLSVLLYSHSGLRADPSTLAGNRQGQSSLWPYAISGDYPILLICIRDRDEADLLYEVLRAHAYWRKRQLKVDLVILNERETGYADELHSYVHRLIARTGGENWMNRRGGVFVLRADQLDEGSRTLLQTAAGAILRGNAGSLGDQLARLEVVPAGLPDLVPSLSGDQAAEVAESTPAVQRPQDLLFDNGRGGFGADGREYVIYLQRDGWTPAPWINVIVNASFGFLVSESGSGYTWSENSGENRLTPWRNDPVSDTPGEALYLRDEETGEVWSPTPLPARASAPYLVRHGAGYSIFEHCSHGLCQRLRLFAVPDRPVKIIQLKLENLLERYRRITATFYAEWVLGTNREGTQQYIVPEFDLSRNLLLARNTYSEEFRERVAFVAASKELHGLTCDRTEFLGREGDMAQPAALRRLGLSGRVEPGLDPCAAAQIHVDLAPGDSTEVFFLLGQGADYDEALRLVENHRDAAAVDAAWEAVNDSWDHLLSTVQVETPEPTIDLLLNRWLLYQALSCRVWARSALYQSSGAFGFRDQLQDVMALTHAAPEIARQHILRAARHQFEAGDVLHWWHPPSGRGVRTRYADDLLWLPFVTAHYVECTGDESVLREELPFRRGDPLEAGEVERYGHYKVTTEAQSLYEHCCRALDKGSTAGPHGLPLMGSGDWNDGMNQVGVNGRGESVWLGWFLYANLQRFAPLCELMGDGDRASECRERAQDLRQALEEHGWDGGWYLRAYFDDGTPLGSAQNLECQVASIAQSWAVLSGAADAQRAEPAMEAVWENLLREKERLLLLFTPPFDRSEPNPGYIKGYPPGIRENGGQYTHAALWATWAFALLGQGDRAEALFRLLNPIGHSATPERVARYRVEPYVIAADIYSNPAHLGRGGWTWYTGSAAWMYRVGLEAILGLRREGDVLYFEPCVPREWSEYSIRYRDGRTHYHIRIMNPQAVNRGVKQVSLDGGDLPGAKIPLLGDGKQHEVQVWMG